MRRSLWATLQAGTLERIVVEDGLVTPTFDVPRETGVRLPLDTLEALGEAYGSAWNEQRPKGRQRRMRPLPWSPSCASVPI